MRIARWSFVIGMLTICSPAHAGELQGQIVLPGKGVARDAVIAFESTKKSKPLSKMVIDQRDKTFTPHVAVVTVGTTVDFPNHDTVFHNVFAYYNAKKFDLGMYPRGSVKRVTFDKPGYVALLCNVHSEMSAYIVVLETPYYAMTDKQGKFRIPNVPPGSYTMRVWHESGNSYSKVVEVREQEPPFSLTLTRK